MRSKQERCPGLTGKRAQTFALKTGKSLIFEIRFHQSIHILKLELEISQNVKGKIIHGLAEIRTQDLRHVKATS
ncbi:MAG: hypothetical protein PWP08_2 [Methanofollis sp.]|nr:hypothetical protein [Methanofollis sp.]